MKYFGDFDCVQNKVNYKELIHQMVVKQMQQSGVYDSSAMAKLMAAIEIGH